MSISPARAEKRLQTTVAALTEAQKTVDNWTRSLAEFTRGFEDAAGAIEALDLAKVAFDANEADLVEATAHYDASVRLLPTFDPLVEEDSAKITLLLVKQEELRKLIETLKTAIAAKGFNDYIAERAALSAQVETWLVKIRGAKESLHKAELTVKMYVNQKADQERALQLKVIAFPILISRHVQKARRPGFRDAGKHSKQSILSARTAAGEVLKGLAASEIRVRATDTNALPALMRGTGSPTSIRESDLAKLGGASHG